MNSELKELLVAALKNMKNGASTRHLCNILFKKVTPTAVIYPGDADMQWTYRSLKALTKAGRIKNESPGYWSIVIE